MVWHGVVSENGAGNTKFLASHLSPYIFRCRRGQCRVEGTSVSMTVLPVAGGGSHGSGGVVVHICVVHILPMALLDE